RRQQGRPGQRRWDRRRQVGRQEPVEFVDRGQEQGGRQGQGPGRIVQGQRRRQGQGRQQRRQQAVGQQRRRKRRQERQGRQKQVEGRKEPWGRKKGGRGEGAPGLVEADKGHLAARPPVVAVEHRAHAVVVHQSRQGGDRFEVDRVRDHGAGGGVFRPPP